MKLIIFYLLYPLLKGISLLPHKILYFLSDILKFLFFKVIKYRLKVVKKNIAIAFPKLSIKKQKEIISNFYKHLTDIFIEMIKSISLSKNQAVKRYKFKNLDILREYKKNNRSIILLLGHYSSWEGMLTIGNHLDFPSYAIYTPLTNKYFNKLIFKSRQRHNSTAIDRYKIIKVIKQNLNLNKIGIYGFAMDQSPNPRKTTYWRSFMGKDTPVFNGAEIISKKYDLPVVYASISRKNRGYYEIIIQKLTDNPKQTKKNYITDKFFEILENQIKTDPSQYLWTHNRYKYSDLN